MLKWIAGAATVSALAGLLVFGAGSCALAQEHSGHSAAHQALHEQFYSKWMRPNFRKPDGRRMGMSCCDDKDCRPHPIVQRGAEFYVVLEDGREMLIPEGILEETQADQVESPDGQSHACVSFQVWCATRGLGQ